MAKNTFKRLWVGLLLFVILIVTIFIGLPVYGSMRLVDTQIVSALEALTGHDVKLLRKPRIGVFPRLHVVLDGLELSRPDKTEDAVPTFVADETRLDLSAWSVINGRIRVQNTVLIRPVLTVSLPFESDGHASTFLGGSLQQRLRTAEILVRENPLSPQLDSIRELNLGPISIEGGILRFAKGVLFEETTEFTAIDGTISANRISGPLRARLDSIWKGESLSVDLNLSNLLSAAAGGPANANLSLESAPIMLQFSGDIGLIAPRFFEGPIEFSTPSLDRALNWSGYAINLGRKIGSVQLTAAVRAREDNYYFDESEITLDENLGTGSIEISLADSIPHIRGTLDFSSLDLGALVTDILALGRRDVDDINLDISRDMKVDLRLSTNTALIGEFNAQDVAASIQIKPGSIAVDMNDGQLFGGQVQAAMRIQETSSAHSEAELKILANDIDGQSLFSASGWDGISLNGPLTLSLITSGPFDRASDLLTKTEGSFSMRSSDLIINGLALETIEQSLNGNTFLPLKSSGQSSVSVFEAKGALASGTFRFDELNARLDGSIISLSGLYAHPAKSLAFAGTVEEVEENGEPIADGNTQRFFLGGSPTEPFISPILPVSVPEQR